jgi:DNA-binding response OmpR family regulator
VKITGPPENLPEVPPANKTVAVLAVSPHEEDHVCLRAIFRRTNWKVFQAGTCREALSFLSENRITVLVCERDLPDRGWKALNSLSALPLPPLLVVASRDADDALCTEVLNLGAYDVLSKPFDPAEVKRIVSLAWRHWKEEAQRRLQKRTARAGGTVKAGTPAVNPRG